MSDCYTLDKDKNVVPTNRSTWATSLDDDMRHVANTAMPERDAAVSTVFLGMDHYWGNDPDHDPVVFETMVFGGDWDQAQERYTSWDDALAGHERWVQKVKDIQLVWQMDGVAYTLAGDVAVFNIGDLEITLSGPDYEKYIAGRNISIIIKKEAFDDENDEDPKDI